MMCSLPTVYCNMSQTITDQQTLKAYLHQAQKVLRDIPSKMFRKHIHQVFEPMWLIVVRGSNIECINNLMQRIHLIKRLAKYCCLPCKLLKLIGLKTLHNKICNYMSKYVALLLVHII